MISADDRIDELCDEFEAEWLRGRRPHIADFLERVAKREQSDLFYELLLVELEYRRNQGERLSQEEYLREFPHFAESIEAANFGSVKTAFATTAGGDDETLRLRLPQPGNKLGHFELLERIGSGAMGEVWKAWDPRLRRNVAVKLPRFEATSEADLRRFLREGQAAAQLHHPHIASIHEVGRDGDTAYMVADFVDGDNLRRYLATQPLKYQTMAELCAAVAEALHHAHEQGVVHRDLKPANIIIDRSGRPHVIDFGLAKWSNDDRELTLHGELLGTPAYMSPEQANGDAVKLERRADVYSLGVILYEMLVGRCPFVGDRGSVINQILACDPMPPRSLDAKIPRDLETICLKALEKEPGRRYATAQEMAVDLRRFARGEPILARRVGLIEKGTRCVRRRPGLAAALVLLVAVVVAASAMIHSLDEQNYRLQGYRPVFVQTEPPGAHLAFVPINKRTGEPDPMPSGIVKPSGTTPLTTWLKPGDYFVEAVLPGDARRPEFAETYATVSSADSIPLVAVKQNRSEGRADDLNRISIGISKSRDVIGDMVAVSLDEEIRRKNPLLPKLLYVDPAETTGQPTEDNSHARESMAHAEDEQQTYSDFNYAQYAALYYYHKRLPSAAEYDAIAQASRGRTLFTGAGRPAHIEKLFGGLAEWTTTKYDFPGRGQGAAVASLRGMHILKGYGDPNKLPGLMRMPDGALLASPNIQSPHIGFRCVRSGTPRFVTP